MATAELREGTKGKAGEHSSPAYRIYLTGLFLFYVVPFGMSLALVSFVTMAW